MDELLKANVPFIWDQECWDAFETLLYPEQPPSLIWQSNGLILRVHLINLWILLLMEVLGMYIWLLAPTLHTFDVPFWCLKAWGYNVFHRLFELWWLMIEISYLLLDHIIQLVVVSYFFELFFMVCSLLEPFGLTFAPQKPSKLFSLQRTLSTLRTTLFTLWRLVFFVHFNWFMFTNIVLYDFYYVKNHPPKEFQVQIFPFDWVLGAMTFRLPLGFNPIFSYSKPHGLTWYQGYSHH